MAPRGAVLRRVVRRQRAGEAGRQGGKRAEGRAEGRAEAARNPGAQAGPAERRLAVSFSLPDSR